MVLFVTFTYPYPGLKYQVDSCRRNNLPAAGNIIADSILTDQLHTLRTKACRLLECTTIAEDHPLFTTGCL
jgi:hypothetical protein